MLVKSSPIHSVRVIQVRASLKVQGPGVAKLLIDGKRAIARKAYREDSRRTFAEMTRTARCEKTTTSA